jgi:Ca2+-binding EF-hand superfamily protein
MVFDKIKLTQTELDLLFTAFDDLDENGSGFVNIDQFFTFFKLESNEFSRELFKLFDSTGSNQFTFLEFVCMV